MARPSRLGLGRNESKVISLRVPAELHEQWREYCKTHGEVTSQEGLRSVLGFLVTRPTEIQAGLAELIKGMLIELERRRQGQGSLVPDEPAELGDSIDRGKKKRVEIGFTPSEYEKLAAIAEERECSVQYWITSLTRAALTKGVTVGGAELKALGEFNYQLMAIGRNLNQVVHQINADPAQHLYRLQAEAIERVGAKIDEGRKATHALVNACSHRWEIV